MRSTSLLIFALSWPAAALPTWTLNDLVPTDGRGNILELSPSAQGKAIAEGQVGAQIYPVEITGILLPAAPLKNDINFRDLGLHPYPAPTDQGVYQVAYPNGDRPKELMGYGEISRAAAKGFTFSCAACHSGNLFGKTVLGLTNRFPKANHFFAQGKTASHFYNSGVFQFLTGATDAETSMMTESMKSMGRVAVKEPLVLGLDTSLAQVSLSLNLRAQDPWASFSSQAQDKPRGDILDDNPADSKPAVWWNIKYKNRWLSDGSVISGDPIFTNILWNEIGRGTDLHLLADWFQKNPAVIENLTAEVFSAEAPRITDFFSADRINLDRAKAGEKIYLQKCAHCHGTYDKAWSHPAQLHGKSKSEWLRTIHVYPVQRTFVKDVGTDPWRWKGMKSLEKLNDLQISKDNQILIQAQQGYVPPPLVGIWARWPYLHNNSVPSLCDLLTPAPDRRASYYAGEANNPDSDFDFECNGYPDDDNSPSDWHQDGFLFDSTARGLSNEGHDEGIFVENGVNTLSPDDRKNLIQFLQTL
jgi:mono/diheme cytochrome c family protein